MSLQEYKKKRDFRKTREPKGGKKKTRTGRSFVVQKHDASRLHYDFRLELDGVLKSWAVPKGPSLNPKNKHLAVMTEDHPIEYGEFEGIIPEGEYGGGTVMLWDKGTWEPVEDDPAKALRNGKLSFTLKGERLKGEWALVRMRSRDDDDEGKNWLLLKHKDEFADGRRNILKEDTSVETGRSMEEIAADEDAVWKSGRKSKTKRKKKKAATRKKATTATRSRTSKKAIDPSSLDGARKSALPKEFKPELATLVTDAPTGDNWIHEIKYDGYRLLCMRDGDKVRVITRQGKDWTSKFGPIAESARKLPIERFILDGEAVVLDNKGHSSFQQLQNAIKAKKFKNLAYFVFDLPWCDGFDLSRVPLLKRKKLLNAIVSDTNHGMIRYSDHVVGGGEKVHNRACEIGLEGIIAKRADSMYQQRRTRDWVKVKCAKRQEFIIVGYTDPAGSRKHFGALLLAAHDKSKKLIYTGKVGTGFDSDALKDIGGRLKKLERKTSPLDVQPPPADARGAHWVTPELIGEVHFTEWTDDGRLRHPAFLGLREDKKPSAITIEQPVETEDIKGAGSNGSSAKSQKKNIASRSKRTARRATTMPRTKSKTTDEVSVVEGVKITNPDRVMYPEQGLTKRNVIDYILKVGGRMLPFVENRPLSVVRCPQGRQSKCFYQKHLGETLSKPIIAIDVKEDSGESADYIGVNNLAGLVALVQFGVLEIHPWGAKKDNLEKPDYITFDLDPGENVSTEAVIDAAHVVRGLLEKLDLQSFVKTSGGKGLHIVVPIERRSSWDDVRTFARGVAEHMAQFDGKKYIATASKAKRKGKIYIDYLRNSRGATSVAPYSPRARAGAPVSAPIRWDELDSLDSFARYTVENLPARLLKLKKDPWGDYFKMKQRLTSKHLEAMRGA